MPEFLNAGQIKDKALSVPDFARFFQIFQFTKAKMFAQFNYSIDVIFNFLPFSISVISMFDCFLVELWKHVAYLVFN